MRGGAMQAAEQLVGEGVDVEVVDLRTLTPLDTETILASVRKTGRLVVLYEATRTGGFAGEVAAVVMEGAFADLKAPLRRVMGLDIPVPASPPLERFYLPEAGRVVAASQGAALRVRPGDRVGPYGWPNKCLQARSSRPGFALQDEILWRRRNGLQGRHALAKGLVFAQVQQACPAPDMPVAPLEPAELYCGCDPEQFRFATTAELASDDNLIPQERALEAIHFGVGVRHRGYNLFALGPAGTGKWP